MLKYFPKKTVLAVVKLIALARQEYDDIWKDKSFKKEIDRSTKGYENGTAKLYKFEEMKKSAIDSYNEKAALKNEL